MPDPTLRQQIESILVAAFGDLMAEPYVSDEIVALVEARNAERIQQIEDGIRDWNSLEARADRDSDWVTADAYKYQASGARWALRILRGEAAQ